MLARALCHVDNAYWIPHVRVHGRVARTHKTSQTAFRGFGGPQGMLVVEDILGRCAPLLGIDPVDLRRRNFYVDGQATPYGQVVRHPERAGRRVGAGARHGDVVRRRAEVAAFNAAHPHRKRGLAVTPVKFGISFNFTAFNQAGALVHVYKDGSVLINHGGTEMGQGLHTKMLQVAATTLGVPLARSASRPPAPTRCPTPPRPRRAPAPTSTAARSRTPASRSWPRLREVDAGRGLAWEELVREAYFSRVQLWAAGFYRTEGIHWDSTQMSGHPVQVLRLRRRGGRGRGRRLHRRLPHPAGRHRARRRRQPLPARRPRPGRGRLRAGSGLADAGGPALGRVRRSRAAVG